MSHTHYTTLISAHALNERLSAAPGSLFLVDCRFDLGDPGAGEIAYAAGHLRGAHYLHLDRDLAGAKTGKNGRHPLPERATLAAALAARGLNQGQQVVVYDAQGGMFAARAWWLLRWLGHDAVAVLDGGLQAWQTAGLPLVQEVPSAARGNFREHDPLQKTVDVFAVERNLSTHEFVVVDARAADRYRGENETLDPAGGHIPGALNRFFKHNLADDGRFKPAQTLRKEFGALLCGTPPEHVALQCGSGVTACHNALALEIAGLHGATLYPGSWSEWCADPARPIATGAQP